MTNSLIEYLKNKKILILGFGLEGYSTYKFIRKHLSNLKIYISDSNENVLQNYADVVSDSNIEFIKKENYLKNLEEYDLILKTPGISFKNIDTSKFIDKITSQLDLFLKFCNVFTIGVTGTKGKSTTSSLIYTIIHEQNENVFLLGNIGTPLFDEIDNLNKDSIVVLELSSHQLEYVKSSVNIAILLNIFEEHLDHYKSYNHYIDAKLNICKYQNENDYLLYNIDNNTLNDNLKNCKIKSNNLFEISYNNNEKNFSNSNIVLHKNNKIILNNNTLYLDSPDRKLLGNHNLNNIMFAITVAHILNLDLMKACKSIYNFEPLPHRLEYVGIIDGVKYYNDSIATIPEAAINAILTLGSVNTLIVGGKDRGVDLHDLINFLNTGNIENIICLPDTGWLISKHITNSNINIYNVDNLNDAVKIAKKYTRKNEICLLSPAASSYGFFKNFQERGNLFKQLVQEDVTN